ncbi:hypothetical protein J2850_000958 [Azospirillum picis]|uniref:Uncharacterized protein n=1 Tax=Azospirillum picis TaxID=488438 RepID=A0ABU0MFA5_9PROT|nr:hypothetical protein [Azospirillum picis]MDQ0532121.1 hypothetical protein [Azospirillum picis]
MSGGTTMVMTHVWNADRTIGYKPTFLGFVQATASVKSL